MEATMYLPKQIMWRHESIESFDGKNREFDPVYTLGITPPDPADRNYVLFNVWVEKKVKNLDKNKDIFLGKIYYCFRVKNEGNRPSAEYYYALIQRANEEFEKTLLEKTKGTNLAGIRAFCPPFDFLRKDIQKTIAYWDKNDRYKSLN